MITHFVIYFVTSIIRLLEFMFFARAIMSWFVQGRESKIAEFLYMVTEPIILPFRKLIERVPFLQSIPLDIAFLLAFFSLELILMLLYSL